MYTRWMSIAWWASCLSTWGKRAGTLLLSPALCFCEKLILLLFGCPISDTPRSIGLDLMTTLLLELLFLLIFDAFSPFYNFQFLNYNTQGKRSTLTAPSLLTSFKAEWHWCSPPVLQHTVYLISNRQLHSVWGRCRCEG